MSLYKSKTVYAASERNTLQQVEKFNYVAVVFTSDRGWSEEADIWIVKANTVLRVFMALWSQNGRFQTPQSCQFSNRSLFRSLPMILNLG